MAFNVNSDLNPDDNKTIAVASVIFDPYTVKFHVTVLDVPSPITYSGLLHAVSGSSAKVIAKRSINNCLSTEIPT